MTVQTSYTLQQGVGYAGQLFDVNPHEIVSRTVETVAGAAFGLAVGRGTDKAEQVLVGTADFTGITIRSLDKEGAINTGAIQWNENDAAGILREGYIWAICPAGCTAGDQVKYLTATGVLDAGVAGVGSMQLDGAQWDSTAAAGEVGVIRLSSLDVTVGS